MVHRERQQQFYMAPAMELPNSTVSTPLQWILKNVLFYSLQFFPLNFDHQCSVDMFDILAVEKMNLVIFCRK